MTPLPTTLSEFVKTQFDKLLLFVVLALLSVLLVGFVFWSPNKEIIPWVEKSFDVTLGSFLTLITGNLFRGQSRDQSPENTESKGDRK